MNTETKLRTYLVILFLTLLWGFTMYLSESRIAKTQTIELKKQKVKIDSLQKLSDSLSMELFPKEIELGRYEVAFRIFMERNPKAASQYGDIISNETE